MKLSWWTPVLAAVGLALPQNAPAASIMTFESLAAPGTGYTYSATPSIYTEAGFTVSSSTFSCLIQSENPDLYMGSTGLSNCIQNGVNTLTKVGGGAFTLSSIDLAPFGRSYGAGALVPFVGTKSNGSTVSVNLTAPLTFGFQTFSFSGFDNVTSVSWTHVYPYHQFDNITLDAGTSMNLLPGYNLLGNGSTAALDVVSAFGDAAKVDMVWKWTASPGRWSFYTPTLGDGGAAYAASHGFDFLTAINGGEGFWVNAKIPFTVQLPGGTGVLSASFQSLSSGWSLIATSDAQTPSLFNRALSPTTPPPGVTPLNMNTLWAWDPVQTNWYFYAPSLEGSGGLTSYIQSRGFLDFGAGTLVPGMGFWVNKP